jgi:predicted DNA-binding protein (MmcQ/YjbR family)
LITGRLGYQAAPPADHDLATGGFHTSGFVIKAMNKQQLKKLCRALPGANERLLADPYNILVYSLDERNFAYFKTSEPERWRFSIKVSPDRFIELTGVPGVKPARYRGRYHWITIIDVNAFPAGYLRELVIWSYRNALGGLSKVRQRQVTGHTS